jgi:WD40 repeat protein
VVGLPDGRYAACSSYDGRDVRNNGIYVWRDKDESYTLFRGHTEPVCCLAVLPDGNLASGSGDRTIRIWVPATGDCVRVIDVGMSVKEAVVLSDGRLACGYYFSHEFKVVNVATGSCERVLEFDYDEGCKFRCLAALPEGRVTCGSTNGAIKVWDTTTGNIEVSIIAPHAFIEALCLLPDERLASGAQDQMIRIWS